MRDANDSFGTFPRNRTITGDSLGIHFESSTCFGWKDGSFRRALQLHRFRVGGIIRIFQQPIDDGFDARFPFTS